MGDSVERATVQRLGKKSQSVCRSVLAAPRPVCLSALLHVSHAVSLRQAHSLHTRVVVPPLHPLGPPTFSALRTGLGSSRGGLKRTITSWASARTEPTWDTPPQLEEITALCQDSST